MEILLFGITREIIGKSVMTVSETESLKTVGALRNWLLQMYPEIGRLSSLAIAVNSEYATDEVAISENSEVALIPPVSGG